MGTGEMGKKKFAAKKGKESEKGPQMNNKPKAQNTMGVKMENNSSIKKKRPKSKKIIKANNTSRLALAMGEVAKTSEVIKKQRDARTLYLRFQNKLPSTDSEVKELHSDIKFVRVPRKVKNGDTFSYCFLEFGTEQECTKAKNKLANTKLNGEELYVDFVGDKSKTKGSVKKEPVDPTSKGAINPYRLLVSGLAPGVKAVDLKSMFPKASKAEIPQSSVKKGSSYGFVQFSEPAHAKAAFDDAQNLNIDGHHITVLYAKRSEGLEELREKRKNKRKAKLEKKKEKSKKQKIEGSDAEKENRKDGSEDESEEEEESEVKEDVQVKKNDVKEDDKVEKSGVKEDVDIKKGDDVGDENESEEENDEDSDEEEEELKTEKAGEEDEDGDEENDEDSDEEDETQVEGNDGEENDEEDEEDANSDEEEDADSDEEENE